jgi:hypothetical protein
MSTNETETRARTMGWLPKDQFKGPAERHLSAEDYLKRGEEILPIMQANNRKLTESLTRAEAELATTNARLKAATESIEELKDFRTTLNKERATEQKVELTKALREARANNDVDAEVALEEKLDQVKDALKEAAKPPVKPVAPATPSAGADQPTLTPAAKEWMAANPWFSQDKRKTGYAMGLADEWKASGKALSTPEFFDFVDQEMAKQFDQNTRRREAPSKVGGTNNSSGGDDGGGRSFADLPPEAQAACNKSAQRLVGKDRAYKTLADWQKEYVKTYDWS